MAPTTGNPGGLTTIPECWDTHDSKNHMILAQIDEWFTSGLAGIRQAPGSVGYRKLVVDPRVADDLTHVDGRYMTPYGEVACEWSRKHGVFRLEVDVRRTPRPRCGCRPAAASRIRPRRAQRSSASRETAPCI